jgi:hypothetical protein
VYQVLTSPVQAQEGLWKRIKEYLFGVEWWKGLIKIAILFLFRYIVSQGFLCKDCIACLPMTASLSPVWM